MPATQRVHAQEWAELQAASPCGSAPLRDLLSSLLLLFFCGRAGGRSDSPTHGVMALRRASTTACRPTGRGSTSTKANRALRLIINRCITRPAKRTQSSCDSVSMITNRKACQLERFSLWGIHATPRSRNAGRLYARHLARVHARYRDTRDLHAVSKVALRLVSSDHGELDTRAPQRVRSVRLLGWTWWQQQF